MMDEEVDKEEEEDVDREVEDMILVLVLVLVLVLELIRELFVMLVIIEEDEILEPVLVLDVLITVLFKLTLLLPDCPAIIPITINTTQIIFIAIFIALLIISFDFVHPSELQGALL